MKARYIFLIGLLAVSGTACMEAIFLGVASSASVKLLPIFQRISIVAFLLVVFIFLPLAIFRQTRPFAGQAMIVSSFVFGITAWMLGLLLTLWIWGFGAVVVGLFIAGIGVVPIALLATAIKGHWGYFVGLLMFVILTFGCRIGGLKLAELWED